MQSGQNKEQGNEQRLAHVFGYDRHSPGKEERRDAGPTDEESRPTLDRDRRAHRRRRWLVDHASFGYTAFRCSVNPKRSGIASRWSAFRKLTVGQDYWLCCQLSCRITAIKP